MIMALVTLAVLLAGLVGALLQQANRPQRRINEIHGETHWN